MHGGSVLTVRQASFRGMTEVNGQPMAGVEVLGADPSMPGLLAYFRRGPKGYQLVRVLLNDARTDVDWYDNNLHQAFEDVTQTLFSGPSHAALNDRREFGLQVLAADGIRDALDRHFASFDK